MKYPIVGKAQKQMVPWCFPNGESTASHQDSPGFGKGYSLAM